MTWRSRLLWFVLGAAFTGASVFGYFMYQAVQSILGNPYYVWHASAMVIDYMRTHDNRWPTSWDDLSKTNPAPGESGGFQNFDEVKKNVVIDWNARPEVLVNAKFDDDNDDQPAFRVIWLRNGRSIHWSCAEPNRLIWDYLQQHKQELLKGAP